MYIKVQWTRNNNESAGFVKTKENVEVIEYTLKKIISFLLSRMRRFTVAANIEPLAETWIFEKLQLNMYTVAH